MITLIVVAIVAVCYLLYQNYTIKKEYAGVMQELALLQMDYASTTIDLLSLQKDFAQTENERDQLERDLDRELVNVQNVAEQLQSITGTVGILEKLRNTDEELLQKYSKVYFLNEHYRPAILTQIDTQYTYNKKEQWIHPEVWPFFDRLVKDASANSLELLVISAFRSFDEQINLKSSYTVIYGEGTANQFSADQGYSEHQLGTTVDFTTTDLGSSFTYFADEPAYEWLRENAHKYGFILSYPKDNTYYRFEPWHWRFVGVKLATKLYNDGIYFRDLDQREIDEYLASLFD